MNYNSNMDIAIVFASLSGHTTTVATNLQADLVKRGHVVTVYDMLETAADNLKLHDLVFMGSSTYGEGDLNPIAEMFFSSAKIEKHACGHTKFAIFSMGDSSYPQFAAGGKIMVDNLSSMGASIISPVLTLDGPPTEEMFAEVRKWSTTIVAKAMY